MISVDHVTKTYGTFTAVDNVTFTARPGRITGSAATSSVNGWSNLTVTALVWLVVPTVVAVLNVLRSEVK
ncbi:MAG TPA: hypothetical protein VES42_03760 [Pilimelia sp.]|nr:hypothetical protein [Pilimelia sp.]